MTQRLERNVPFLEVIARGTPKQKQGILEGASNDLCRCLAEICHNVLKGCLNLTNREAAKLKKHKTKIRFLGDRKVSLTKKKKLVQQQGGFLSLLAAPLLSIIGDLVVGGIKKAVARRRQRKAAAFAKHKKSLRNNKPFRSTLTRRP